MLSSEHSTWANKRQNKQHGRLIPISLKLDCRQGWQGCKHLLLQSLRFQITRSYTCSYWEKLKRQGKEGRGQAKYYEYLWSDFAKKNVCLKILQKFCQRNFLIYVDVAGMQRCLYLLSFSTFATAQLFQMTALNKLQEFSRMTKRKHQFALTTESLFQKSKFLNVWDLSFHFTSPPPFSRLNKNRSTVNHNILAWGQCNCLLC